MSALRKLQWAKDTPRWVTTNTTSKKGAKGSIGCFCCCGLLWFDWGVAAAITITTNTNNPSKADYGHGLSVFIFAVVVVASNTNNDYLDTLTLVDFSA